MKNLHQKLLIQAKETFKKGEHISENGFKNFTNEESVFILGENCWLGDILVLDEKDGLMKRATYKVFDGSYQKEWEKLHNQTFDLT